MSSTHSSAAKYSLSRMIRIMASDPDDNAAGNMMIWEVKLLNKEMDGSKLAGSLVDFEVA